MNNNKRLLNMTVQLWLGVILAVVGVVLLFISLYLPEVGVIHSSVLTAVGETFTFSGALTGIDYTYRYKYFKLSKHESQSKDD